MKKLTALTVLVAFVIFKLHAATGVEIMEKSMNAIAALKGYTFTFYAQERFKDAKIISSEVEMKVNSSPLKIYANAKKPQTAQLIYIPSKSADVSVKKGIKLSLSPTSKLLIGEQHNPITRAGFGQVRKILLKSMEQRKGANLDAFCKLVGTVTYDGKECHKIELIDANYKIVNYTVKAGETNIWKFCEARAIPEYKVKELNDCGNELTVGAVIKIPTAYAKKTTLYVDKTTNLPIYQRMEDDKGMYEQYEFKNLKINVALTDADFEFK